MIKREYLKQLVALDIAIDSLSQERRELNKAFKQDCKHPLQNLNRKSNWYEDEYGYTVESWTDYDYSCTRCGTKFTTKDQNMSVQKIREQLVAAAQNDNGY